MTTKSALQFPLDEPIPFRLIKELVRNRIRKHKVGGDCLRARRTKRQTAGS
ncbi:MAG: hypothetical protein ACREBS_06200 [Nitrososphaerales archaeon]